MKPTDFALHLTTWLSMHLPGVVGASENTIRSYRDTFSLLLLFCEKERALPPERCALANLNRETVEEFLNWLEEERRCSVATRNQRLAALHAFFKHLQSRLPQRIFQLQEVLAIPMKRLPERSVSYLTVEAVGKLFGTPDGTTRNGRRDLALLSLLYESGARVQEIADLRAGDVRLHPPATVKLKGKGNKTRIVPLMEPMARLIERYLKEEGLSEPRFAEHPLFRNASGEKLSRSGIAHILRKHFDTAKSRAPTSFPDSISPHVVRHSKAMHLLQSDVDLIYIRDVLGHSSVRTTEIYARADSAMKRRALEAARSPGIPVVSDEVPEWQSNKGLLEWLKGLGRQ